MILVTDKEGKITYYNTVAQDSLNIQEEHKDEPISSIFMLLDEDGHEFDSNVINRTYRTGIPEMYSGITISKKNNPEEMKADFMLSPLIDQNFERSGTVITIKKN